MLAPLSAGFITGGSLILAIGAQNAYVLRQGLTRSHTATVVAVCTVSDIVLIAAGVAGVGTVVAHAGWVIEAVTWFGVVFLLWYAAGSVRRAFHPAALTVEPATAAPPEPRTRVLGRAAALTWLNPHVYLDTLLIGSIAATHASAGGTMLDGRWFFAIGAAIASIIWFSSLGLGAHKLAPLLTSPRSWQILELIVAATMVLVATKLALG